MLISLNWLRDFVDVPADLDPRDMGERFTRTTAEVEGVEEIRVAPRGLIAAAVKAVAPATPGERTRSVTLDIGHGKSAETVTSAQNLRPGDRVLFAPPGAAVASLGAIGTATVAGRASAGMILAADSVGIPAAGQEAVFLPPDVSPGDAVDAGLFDDWVIEIDNKSLTNRPDLWGHYGVAREVAAILKQPLKPYPVTPLEELNPGALPAVPIRIADGNACPRYSALVLEGVPTQPAPLWMQLRLGHVGLRPISGLVDLTNYIMCDLGQPMHAFDAAKLTRIEVDWAKEGERFRTLDGVERTLTGRDLMIQSGGQSVALAGVMGGSETEVTAATRKLLLESANFDGATIRRTATRLSLRTDASARFEKSLDPANTALGIQRFVLLARTMYPRLTLGSRFSDAHPKPLRPMTIQTHPRTIARYIGRDVPLDEMKRLLEPLGFKVGATPSAPQGEGRGEGNTIDVTVPSFRATGDVSIEADVIEELARSIGYNVIAPALPRVTVRRFPINAMHELENRTIEEFTTSHGFHELHGYIWYDQAWLKKLGVDPGHCVELVNPAGEGLQQLRRSLLPGLLAAADRNRFFLPAFSLLEIGGIFEPASIEDREFQHLGLLIAERGKGIEDRLFGRLKGAIEAWSWRRFAVNPAFRAAVAAPNHPWEHEHRTAAVQFRGLDVGRASVIPLALRRAMDEHLAAWSMGWAEIRLSGLESLEARIEPLECVPEFPLVDMDFSILVAVGDHFDGVVSRLVAFQHPLLRSIRFVTAYEGDPIPRGSRSLTFRTVLGHPERTLTDDDLSEFRRAFESHLSHCGFGIRH